MFELNGISKSFKKDFYAQKFLALKNTSFKVRQGEITGFLGANGAGKTTSLKIILNFIKPDSGSVKYAAGNYSDFVKKLGYLPERPYFHAGLTGSEFVAYMAELNDVPKKSVRELTDKWARRLEIDHALNRKLSSYSKGMLQRIGFVSCLLHDPEYLILDEPVSGLDPIGRKMIKDVMLELHREGRSIFFSSHIVSDVEEVCSNLIVLDQGSLIYDGTVKDLLSRESTRLCEILLEGNHSQKFENFKSESINKEYTKIVIANDKKSSLLKEIIEANIQIISLKDQNPSLEEIIYKTSGKR